MYYILSLLMGMLIAVLVAVNGGLAAQYGLYSAAVIIHIIGLLFIAILIWLKRERPFSRKHPNVFYFGGAIGVLTIVFASASFGRISVSAILAFGLLGQGIAGLIIDQCGLLGMPKHPFRKHTLIGLSLILAGAASMIDTFEMQAVLLSFAAGLTFVISRTLNARLANVTNAYISTFYHYFIGLIVSILAFLLLGGNEAIYPEFGVAPLSSSWYIYTGGIVGIAVILLGNVTVMKISAFYLTLLVFIGQVLSGILIDLIISQELSIRYFIGVILVTMGLCVNLLLGHKKSQCPR